MLMRAAGSISGPLVCGACPAGLCHTHMATCTVAISSLRSGICTASTRMRFGQLGIARQALPSGELDALLQHSHEHERLLASGGMARAPSMGMGKLESMELPDAVAAVVRRLAEVVLVPWLCIGGHMCSQHGHGQAEFVGAVHVHAKCFLCGRGPCLNASTRLGAPILRRLICRCAARGLRRALHYLPYGHRTCIHHSALITGALRRRCCTIWAQRRAQRRRRRWLTCRAPTAASRPCRALSRCAAAAHSAHGILSGMPAFCCMRSSSQILLPRRWQARQIRSHAAVTSDSFFIFECWHWLTRLLMWTLLFCRGQMLLCLCRVAFWSERSAKRAPAQALDTVETDLMDRVAAEYMSHAAAAPGPVTGGRRQGRA